MPHPPAPIYPRVVVVATVMATLVALLAARLVTLTTGRDAPRPTISAANRFDIPAPRGSIWDRDGDLLAVETYAYEIGVDLPAIGDHDVAAFAGAVAPVLGRPAADVQATIQAALGDRRRRWVSLARGVDAAAAARLEAARAPVAGKAGGATISLTAMGLTQDRLPQRSYPLGPAAAHVTGYLNMDGEADYGVEARYDGPLQGRPGTLAGFSGTDPQGYLPARAGADLRLTIDRDIQVAAAEALVAAVQADEATGGTVVVLDAGTGAILALASWPTYDPNDYARGEPAAFLDPAIGAIYEPGSVVKAMTVAAALDAGVISPDTTYYDEGTVEVDGIEISNWDRLAHGSTTVTEMLLHSLNVGAVHIARRLGPERFYPAMARFGYGTPTGVDLPGEVAGLVHWPESEPGWWPGYLASNSFGQGMSATPLQVAAAMAAIAGDGTLMQPYILAEVIPPDGPATEVTPRAKHAVISPETARTVRRMLTEVVDDKVTQAAIPGYSVGGKTGTSQIPVAGGYDEEDSIASFCGFLPADQPRVVILAKVDRPERVRGSEVGAPLFRKVAEAAIAALDIPPDRGASKAIGDPREAMP